MIYSYHTFLFPFIWEGRGKKNVFAKEFKEVFDRNPNWECINMTDEFRITSNPEIKSDEDAFLFYKEYQYFHPYARKAIYGFEGDIVFNYAFRPQDVRNKAHYYITKSMKLPEITGDTYKEITFDLLVNSIQLKIYNTGIAIFILEGENHGLTKDGEPQNNLNSVKAINDYGRRVSLPFFPPDPNYSISADRLTLSIDGIGEFVSDFKGCIERTKTKKDMESGISLTHFCDFIKKLLSYGGSKAFTSKNTNASDNYFVYSALDDRMFVASYIKDTKEIDAMKARGDDNRPLFYSLDGLSKSLYELLCVDPPGNCCCQDPQMREQEIANAVYTRWLDMGTLTTCTNQALITLTTSDAPTYMDDSFLTQYVQMCCLCLAQRASIINFRRIASSVSAHVEEHGRQIKLSTVSRLMTLQERFVAFQNQLHFIEVTPELQGIELYSKLMQNSFITEEMNSLKEQLDALSDAANTSLDFNFNKWALIFAVPALLMDIFLFLFGEIKESTLIHPLNHHTGFFLVTGLLCLLLLIKYRRKK